MMHPHIPEALHGFGKHLFATFLGLLMAVGLESCHQEHERHKLAMASLVDVEREIQSNLAEVQNVVLKYKKTPEQFQKAIDLLTTIRDARVSHHRWQPPKGDTVIDTTFTFAPATIKSAAWSMALASQSVARFPQGKGIIYAELYEEFQKFRNLQDRPVDLANTELLPKLSISNIPQIDLEDLRRTIWGFHTLKVQTDLMRMCALDLEAKIQKTMGHPIPSGKAPKAVH